MQVHGSTSFGRRRSGTGGRNRERRVAATMCRALANRRANALRVRKLIQLGLVHQGSIAMAQARNEFFGFRLAVGRSVVPSSVVASEGKDKQANPSPVPG